MPFILLSWLFHYKSFITFPFSYFHLLSLSNNFSLVPYGTIFIPLFHFLPELFLNFILKCQKFHYYPRLLIKDNESASQVIRVLAVCGPHFGGYCST